jgi:hydroxyethylthiazole kinase-like uncharacterized protein yjeF
MSVVQRAADLKATDAAAVAAGIPFILLMEAAGRAVAEVVRRRASGEAIVVLCGRGANGGDGLVAARWLRHWGHDVTVLTVGGRGEGHPAEVWDALLAGGVRPESATPERVAAALTTVNAAIDALYGAGFRPPLSAADAALVRSLNAARQERPHLRVVSIDLPSGLAADSAIVRGEPVRADHTVALTTLKPAHLFAPASDLCGRVEVASAGIPALIVESHAAADLAGHAELARLLPMRSQGAHKGSAGRVLVVGGLPRYPGAPALAALGALRAGAGLVTVCSVPGAGLGAPVEATRHEVGDWTPASVAGLADLQADAMCAGMGIGEVDDATLAAILRPGLPTVLDADLLQANLVGRLAKVPAVLTPHPGEASRLLGTTTAEVVADPLAAAAHLSDRYGAVVVLKGGPSVVAAPGRRPWVNSTGNPGMASGGSGDVLSGVIAALLGQDLAPWDAARLGVYLHGAAGDSAARQHGYGLIAGDIAAEIGASWLELAASGRGSGGAL